MSIGLGALDPAYSGAEKQIEGMPPDKAVTFLLSKGVDPRLASLVMKQRMLKQAGKTQGQGQAPQTTVAQDVDSQLNQGVASLPVPNSMFETKHMASGGLVAFAPGGDVDIYSGVHNFETDPAQVERINQEAWAARPFTGSGIPDYFKLHGGQNQGQATPPPPAPAAMSAQAPRPMPPSPQGAPPQGNAPVGPGMSGVPLGPPPGLAPQGQPSPMGPQPAPGGAPGQNPNQSAMAQASSRGPINPATMGHAEGLAMGVVNEDKRNLQKFEDEAGVPVEQHLADILGIAAKQGVGAAATAHLQDLEDRKANIQQLAKQGKWGAIAQAGFAMAQAATVNPHGGFLGALAVGGAKGGELFQQNLQQYHKAMSDLQDQKYAVAQSQENLKLHFTDQAVAEKDKAQQRYDAAYGHYATSVGRLIGVIGGRELQGDISKAMIASRAQLNPANLFAERYINAPDEASKQRALDDYKSWNSASTQVQSAETRGQNAGEVARAKLMNNPAYIAAQTKALSKNPDTAARGQSEIQRLEAAQARLMGSAPQGPAQGAGGPNPSVIEQEMRRRGLLQ